MVKLSKAFPKIQKMLAQRILMLDGAMGTMIQQYHLEEEDFRGDRFADHKDALKGNNDLLVLTRPDVIKSIHLKYLEAGSDIIGTNTFSATSIAQADYDLSDIAFELNQQAAIVAKQAVAEMTATDGKTRFVAGAIGPTNVAASMSPDVNDPGFRKVTYDQLVDSYYEQVEGLVAGGVDLLLPETSFDTLNMKACLFAIEKFFTKHGERIPVMISVTITDQSGRTLSGQTIGAFWHSIRHAKPLSVGVNCALGAKDMRPYIEELSKISDCYISCYPNAGLPNPLSETGYDETPEVTSKQLLEFVESGLVNLVGGCCGTTPDHIKAIAEAVGDKPPRKKRSLEAMTSFSGLEALNLDGTTLFLMVGERTNVTGSPKFRRLIKEGDIEAALSVARQQVENGANIIDINFDDGMIDGVALMTRFLHMVAGEPDICRIPIMLDSSKWEVLEAGLKCVQGKCIVNSISLKEGEEAFLEKARLIKQYGAGVVVMAFDEQGQAATKEDKIRICRRAYEILTEAIDFDPCDIIFDPNILTVATGMDEHNNYAVDFIEAVSEIKKACPKALTSGGISNISFSFRGNNVVREAMHSAFLYHAVKAGLDMGIVNAGMLAVYEDIEPELLRKVEDVLLNRHPEATEALIDFAEQYQGKNQVREVKSEDWRLKSAGERLSHALVKGISDYVDADTAEVFEELKEPLLVIEGPLMDGMKTVGELFGSGKMFLPQVVKSARVMKKSVAYLEPYMTSENDSGKTVNGKFLIATVKGDVHDIGKNIVSVVMACNNFEVKDLGVMVRCEKILDEASTMDADLIGMSGLITPSLEEMIENAKEMERRKMTVPLLIGGATTSKAHTAIKIAPHYSGPVVHVTDASLVVGVCSHLIDKKKREAFFKDLKEDQKNIRTRFEATSKTNTLTPIADARAGGVQTDWQQAVIDTPNFVGVREFSTNLDEIISFIDWSPFFWGWELKGFYPKIFESDKWGEQARSLFADAQKLLDRIKKEKIFQPQAVIGIWPAHSIGDDVELFRDREKSQLACTLHFLRQQKKKTDQSPYRCLADYVAPMESGREDFIGCFAVTMGNGVEKFAKEFEQDHDDYSAILVKALGDRLAEAYAEYMHKHVREVWGYGHQENMTIDQLIREDYRGIRPAPGYPACPDHLEKLTIWELMDVETKIGIKLTESFAMTPASSVSGYYFHHPDSAYFRVGSIAKDQVADYCSRKGISQIEGEKWLAPILGYVP